jgi:ubiquinone/menaquinone biosynthesis C-methylase UbiE
MTDYDPIAEKYQQAKRQPWRDQIESFTLLDLLGDVTGKDIVDLACGEGFYSRRIKRHGAGRVLGVDLSERMIGLARRQEAARPMGIEYIAQDVRDLQRTGEFDVAVAAYLLNYARTKTELEAMCQAVARCLKPTGRFVTVNSNPAIDFRTAPSYRRYGFDTRLEGDLREGTPITWTFFLDDGSFSIENYYLTVATHEEAFRAAGFREVRWHQPRLSPGGAASRGEEFWMSFLQHPPIIFLECLK